MSLDRSHFVGRDAELRQLSDVLERAAGGRGGVVLVEGGAGSGKTLVLRELVRRTLAAPGLGDAVFAFGHCYEETGPQNAFQPFVEMLDHLVRPLPAKRGLLAAWKSILKETAPDWLAAVPVVGPLLSAGAKTATVASGLVLDAEGLKSKSENTLRRYADRIRTLAEDGPLLALVVEDAHWIDHASCELIRLLAGHAGGARLVVVLTCRPTDLSPDDPLHHLRAELLMRGALEVVQLGGLAEAEIAEYLGARFGTVFFREFPSWLRDLCQGHPLFLAQYLNLLEQEGIIARDGDGFRLDGRAEPHDGKWEVSGRLAGLPTSSDIDALLDRRIQRLLDEEREMLQIGAVQGQHFDSLILAQLCDKKELTVLARLRQVAERHRIISRYTGQDWLRDRSEAYAFEHVLLHQAFYRKLSPRERVLYHREIGRALQEIVREYRPPPRKLLIDVGYHSRNGGEHATAASYYMLAATSTYLDGATVEATYLCQEALASLRSLPDDSPDRDARLAECVLLYLVCEMYGPVDRAENLGLVALAEEGSAAAERAGHDAVLAEILASKGQVLIRLGEVPTAISVMRRAVQLAGRTGDPVTEFFTLAQLGKQLSKENLEESLQVRYRAHEVFETRVAASALPPERRDIVVRQFGALILYIGLGEFDRGDYAKAIEYVERGIQELKRLHMFDDLLAGLNYAAQVYSSVGRYDVAELRLKESLEVWKGGAESDLPHPWIGYNLGLLAKVYLETGRTGDALETMDRAMRISEATEQVDLLTLVRNFHAELLMRPDASPDELERAERVLRDNLEHSRAAGVPRSAARSASLLALLMLRRGDPAAALAYSSEAVADLERWGDMPALRTEEVHYNHHLVLSALGRPEAAAYLERAHARVRQKAERLTDPGLSSGFLHHVALNRAILAAYAEREPAPVPRPAAGGEAPLPPA